MPDPKTQLVSFPLDIGIDQNGDPETVQPFGDRPRLVSSVNTRLTATRGRLAKAPARTSLGVSLRRCGGIIPSRSYDSAVAFFHPGDGGNRRITDGSVGTMSALNSAAGLQNTYYPVQVARAGVLPAGARASWGPAVAYDPGTGRTYFATLGSSTPGGAAAITITVIGSDGELVCVPTKVVTYSTAITETFLALTAFSNQVTLWYRSTASNAILAARLTVTGLSIALGSATTIYTPSAISHVSAAIAYDQADTSNVYLVCFQSGSTNARLLRVNPTTFAVTTGLDVTTGADASAKHAIAYVYDGTSGQLIWMVSWPAGACTLFAASATTLVTAWSQTSRLWWADEGSVSCGFYKSGGINDAVFAATRSGDWTTTATALSTPGGTAVEARAFSGGALARTTQIPWYQMVSQVCTVKIETSTQWHAVFSMSPVYVSLLGQDPTSPAWVSDPSIDLMRYRYDGVGGGAYFDLMGRLGTDLVYSYPGHPAGCNSSVYSPGDQRMRLCYLATTGLVRYAEIYWGMWSPRSATLSTGQTIVAAAQPAVWDGSEVTEFQPAHAPKIIGDATGGTGDTLTGTYLFAAVVSWRDGAGALHRSPPSNIVTLSPAGTAPRLWVTVPVTYQNRTTQGSYEISIFASQAGGTTLYQQFTAEDVASSTAFWIAFLQVWEPVQDSTTPALYSDGSATQMKITYAPNAARDVRVIGDRLWLLDAERNRAFYSQPMSTEALSGVFPAMNPTQYVDFPASAGTVVALENWREAPLFFSSTGVWTVDGEGPDALNNPPYFAQPRQLSDVPCTDADSVMLTPVGVIFRSGNRFAIAGASVAVIDDVLANVDVVGVVVFRDQHEIVVFESTGVAHVFNYLKQGWTTWDANVFSSSGAISCVAQDPWTGKALYFSDSATALFSMDPTTTSTTAQMSLQTGRIIIGGPQDDSRISNIAVRCASGGTHGCTLAVGSDYQADQPSKTYSTADVASAVQNSRYDMLIEPRDQPARAVSLSITETGSTGAGMQPINVTLEVLRNPGRLAQVVRTTGRK
jgi:hypothetical protein